MSSRFSLSSNLLQLLARKAGPPIVWAVVGLWTINAWYAQNNTVQFRGQALNQSWEASGTVAGTLLEMRAELFSPVEEGQVLAILDDAPLLAAMQVSRKEVDRLAAEVDAVQANLKAAAEIEQADWAADLRRFQVDFERAKVRKLDLTLDYSKLDTEFDRQTTIAETSKSRATALEDRAGILRKEFNRLESLSIRGLGTTTASDTAQADWLKALDEKMLVLQQMEVAMARVNKLDQSLKAMNFLIAENQRQINQGEERLLAFEETGKNHAPRLGDPRLAALQAAIKVEDARVDEIVVQRRALTLRAKTSGTVASILAQPGQSILPGEPVLTLVKTNSNRILAWAPNTFATEALLGSRVTAKKGSSLLSVGATVVDLGPAYEELPRLLWANPTVPEFGRPLLLELESGSDLVPGEPLLLSARL